ncbi:hypothetical protein AAFF_G00242190 [Aldrovandia affinis]|uniref:Cysteine/serine-rich nuclear protein N-terminal domain-containing protein n=1 Tax=Aldrovandia affinis TaxID=143900 RepID=A0AAD7WU71_9TELE|nr:hypothetical protein AAFF_G00242190 [Aldrovandia affinis]
MEAGRTLSLKRRFEEVDPGSSCSTPKDSDDDISSSDSAESCDSLNPPSTSSLTHPHLAVSQCLRAGFSPPPSSWSPHPCGVHPGRGSALGRKRVHFGAVTVFYFSRRQGFTSVPSQGGSSLGMARHHTTARRYTLGEFAREQEQSHQQTLRQHLHQEKLDARKRKLTRNGTVACAAAETLTLDDVSDEDLDVEGVEVDDCFFLQPLPIKRRRTLLRASGIARIDAREKAELRAIRLSREECGCECRVYCDPRRCGCSQAGIKCQVDRMSFPCGCTRDGCGNGAGRVEFNPLRVRTHYLHTIMKLDLEKRRQLGGRFGDGFEAAELSAAAAAAATAVHPPSLARRDPEPEACPRAAQPPGVATDHLTHGDSLALENEAAVLHLQSAEERERKEQEEEEGGGRGACLPLGEEQAAETVLLQGALHRRLCALLHRCPGPPEGSVLPALLPAGPGRARGSVVGRRRRRRKRRGPRGRGA